MESLVLGGCQFSDNFVPSIENVLYPILTVKCMLPQCSEEFTFPNDTKNLLEHLLLCHCLVIAEVERVAMLAEYIDFWRHKLTDKSLADYCTTMLVDTKSGNVVSTDQKYYLLSDVLPEDNQLRRDLQQKRLERILEHQTRERENKTYERECLFCRNILKGTRFDFLTHLHDKHNFYIAKLDNLIFTSDLIEKLNDKLSNCICVYCEKVFKDRVILKEHMRKKGHKRINPNKKDYDVYFISNYLEMGKNWQSYLKNLKTNNPKKKSISSGSNSNLKNNKDESSSESDSNWSDWNERDNIAIICLFCKHSESQYLDIVSHMNSQHNFNFNEVTKNKNFYEKLKIVNYIRRQIHSIKCIKCNEQFSAIDILMEHMLKENHFTITESVLWNQPEFYFPTYEDDGLLFYLEDDEIEDVSLSAITLKKSKCENERDIDISEEVALSVFD